MILKKIFILKDNYVWILHDIHGFCVIIDPGLSEPIIEEIYKQNWHPIAVLLTHNHEDHVSGVKKIIKHYPKIIVFGPYETRKNSVDQIVQGGDKICVLGRKFYVFFTPGHTSGHVSYYIKPYIFCGDTLFSGGCGRVYNKKYLEMYHSLKIISSLPEETLVCCSHEYTLSNLYFAKSILPNDKNINWYFNYIKKKIIVEKCSLPSYLLLEKKINLFLRTDNILLKKSMNLNISCTSFEVFMLLRLKKDNFGAKRD